MRPGVLYLKEDEEAQEEEEEEEEEDIEHKARPFNLRFHWTGHVTSIERAGRNPSTLWSNGIKWN